MSGKYFGSLSRKVCSKYKEEFLKSITLYTSTVLVEFLPSLLLTLFGLLIRAKSGKIL